MLTPDRINALNPWWTDARWTDRDVHLCEAEAAPFHWDPRPFDARDVASGAVFTLRGPRQSGKTTLAKRLIAERCVAGLARRTCFLSLQTIDTVGELQDAIEMVLRLWPRERGPWFFVLDELTFVRDWARAIVHLREHDRTFRISTVLLTGSSAVDLLASADVLHGRRGRLDRPLDRLHMPLTFRDYVAVRAAAAGLPARIDLNEILSDQGREVIREAALRTRELDQYLAEYARCGGLPRAVADQLTEGRLLDGTMTDLWRGLSADVRRLGRSELILQKLLARIVVALGSLTNWGDLARELDVSKPTVGAYVDVLAASFAVMVLHQRDPKRQGGPSLTKPRKLYFGDPAFARIPAHLQGPSAVDPALVENVMAIALLRHAEREALERFAVPQELFVWRSADGREIDFLVAGDAQIPIESKYARRPTGKDYESMTKAFGRGVVATRTTIALERPVISVPAGVLLALLG